MKDHTMQPLNAIYTTVYAILALNKRTDQERDTVQQCPSRIFHLPFNITNFAKL